MRWETTTTTKWVCQRYIIDPWDVKRGVLGDFKALAKRYFQLKPSRAKFSTWSELGVVWPPTWLELAGVGVNLIKLKF